MADPVTAAVAVGWGMKAVGWLASPILPELFKKGSSILGFDASEKLKELEPKVLLLEQVIEVVQESPYRPCLEQLFNNLKSPRRVDSLMMEKLQSALRSSPLKNEDIKLGLDIHLMQMLDFGHCNHVKFHPGEEMVTFVNLRHATTNVCDDLNNSRSTSLQKLAFFTVRENKQLKHLRDLNKICGSLCIMGLHRVQSKEEALEARLPDKGRLTELELCWDFYPNSTNPEVEAEVFEGLCPPSCLEALKINYYTGATYPNWMVDKQSSGPKYLQKLELEECSRLGPVPQLFEVFIHLRSFSLSLCSWDALPETIVHLKSLKKLSIYKCMRIQSLPMLPQSVRMFRLEQCDEAFMRSCQTIEDPNWQKIQHIAMRKFSPCLSSFPTNRNLLKGVAFDDNVSIIGA